MVIGYFFTIISALPTCSVDEDPSVTAQHCIQSKSGLSRDDIARYFEDISKEAEFRTEGDVLTCRADGFSIRDASTGEIKFQKAKSLIPGAVEAQLADTSNQGKQKLHIISEDHKIIRFDPETNAVESRDLPGGFKDQSALPRFTDDARSIQLNDDPESRINLDDLFKNEGSSPARERPRVTETSAVKSDSIKTFKEPSKTFPRFQPVELPASQEKNSEFSDLLVYDSNENSLRRFPLLWSHEVDVVGKVPKSKSVFVSENGQLAVTYSADGSARIWEQPQTLSITNEASKNPEQVLAEKNLGNSSEKTLELRSQDPSMNKAIAMANDILNKMGASNSKGPLRNPKMASDRALEKAIALLEIQSSQQKELNFQSEKPELRFIEIPSLSDSKNKSQKAKSQRISELKLQLEQAVEALFSRRPERGNLKSPFPPASSPRSSDEESRKLSDYFEWIFILPESLKRFFRRKRDFDRTV